MSLSIEETPRPRAKEIELSLRLILDCIDYTRGACALNEMVGACLPIEFLDKAHKALDRE